MLLATLMFAIAAAVPGPVVDGEALLRRMNESHRDSWFKTMVFVQHTTYPAQPQRPAETWYETMDRPGKLRIDVEVGGKLTGGMIFRDDTLYRFSGGELVGQPQPLLHHLLILLHDIHVDSSPEPAIAKLKQLGFDLDKGHERKWKGRPVIVVGAEAGDTTSAQFWIDSERLVAVRVVMGRGGNLSDTHVGEFSKHDEAFLERDIRFHTNGTLGMVEEYTWVRTDVEIPVNVFDPSDLAPPAWIGEYKAGKD